MIKRLKLTSNAKWATISFRDIYLLKKTYSFQWKFDMQNLFEDDKKTSQLWMRSIDFKGLLNIIHLIDKHPEGITPMNLNREILKNNTYMLKSGQKPSLTTLYHCRNTLLKLKALTKNNGRIKLNSENNYVQILLKQRELNNDSKNAFAELILRNEDSKKNFFDFFMLDNKVYGVKEFREEGNSVTWKLLPGEPKHRQFIMEGEHRKITLEGPKNFNSIIYGVRYWALQLELIDEFFKLDRGSIMYPILMRDNEVDEIKIEILSMLDKEKEWTQFSILDLEVELCEKKRRHKKSLFKAIKKISSNHWDKIYLIATSRSFATITASSIQRENMELKGYFKDAQGRWISHIRIHKSIMEDKNG